MSTKICSEGHKYFTAYYDTCPHCKSQTQSSHSSSVTGNDDFRSPDGDASTSYGSDFSFNVDDLIAGGQSTPTGAGDFQAPNSDQHTVLKQRNQSSDAQRSGATPSNPQADDDQHTVIKPSKSKNRMDQYQSPGRGPFSSEECGTVLIRPNQANNVPDREILGWLVIINHPQGEAYLYEDYPVYAGRNLLGTDEICDIKIPFHKLVSDIHAVIRVENKSVVFTDCDTDQGTYVNGKRTHRQEIFDRDRLQLGSALELSFQSVRNTTDPYPI